jgi:hypothetical protein
MNIQAALALSRTVAGENPMTPDQAEASGLLIAAQETNTASLLYLKETNQYVIDFAENGTAILVAITAARNAARSAIVDIN